MLGTRVTEYLVNHYGPMDDGVNRGDETDRHHGHRGRSPRRPCRPRRRPVVASVAVPHDIEALRRESPTDAAAWRLRVREEFLAHLDDGLAVGGFDDERGYLFVRPS